ncbi:hypothetical protein Hanom_Chr09g00812811 [Helianthus anomalus]
MPPVWLPQSPSCISRSTSLASVSSKHLKYGPARDFLYKILFIIVNRDTFILNALGFSSSGICPSLRYLIIGVGQDLGSPSGYTTPGS